MTGDSRGEILTTTKIPITTGIIRGGMTGTTERATGTGGSGTDKTTRDLVSTGWRRGDVRRKIGVCIPTPVGKDYDSCKLRLL